MMESLLLRVGDAEYPPEESSGSANKLNVFIFDTTSARK